MGEEVTAPGIQRCEFHAWRLEQHTRTHDDHERRLRALERTAWLAAGAAAIAASIGSAAMSLALRKFGG